MAATYTRDAQRRVTDPPNKIGTTVYSGFAVPATGGCDSLLSCCNAYGDADALGL